MTVREDPASVHPQCLATDLITGSVARSLTDLITDLASDLAPSPGSEPSGVNVHKIVFGVKPDSTTLQ